MRLTCNSCGSRFVIDDQLVRGKVVRLLCKHCSNVLEASLPNRPPAPLLLDPGGSPPRPPPPPGRKWYLALFGRLLGPMGLPELRLRVRRGEVLPDDLVWHSGLSGWQPLSLIEELRQELPQRLQRPESAPPPAPAGPLPQQLTPGQFSLLTPLAGSYSRQQPFAGETHLVPAGYAGAEAGPPRAGEQPPPAFSLTPVPGTPQLPYRWAPSAPPGRYAAWPLWLGIIGGLMMFAATVTLLLLHLDARSTGAALQQPAAGPVKRVVKDSRQALGQAGPQVVEVPALEVRGARPAQPDRAADALPRDANTGEQLP